MAAYNHLMPTNGRNCRGKTFPDDNVEVFGAGGANSLHPDGVDVAMSDGSVRFVKATVSMPT